jgi:hypothetical protein
MYRDASGIGLASAAPQAARCSAQAWPVTPWALSLSACAVGSWSTSSTSTNRST